MATSKFQTQKPFYVLLAISITFSLLPLSKVNSLENFSFSITKFVPNQKNLIFQGDARVSTRGNLQLTKVDEDGKPISNSLGRVLHTAPIHIWDSEGNVASFATSFYFVTIALNSSKTADGLAFFLGPIDTEPQKPGGFLGLFNNQNYNSSYQTLAVELDTYNNQQWDPLYGQHIGIDVNSIKSVKTAPWGFRNGEIAYVLVTYQASTQTLVATITYPRRKTTYGVTARVDVRTVLPEWVRVGLTATTGLSDDFVETHDVLAWFFTSKLPNRDSDAVENDTDLASYVLHDSMHLPTY